MREEGCKTHSIELALLFSSSTPLRFVVSWSGVQGIRVSTSNAAACVGGIKMSQNKTAKCVCRPSSKALLSFVPSSVEYEDSLAWAFRPHPRSPCWLRERAPYYTRLVVVRLRRPPPRPQVRHETMAPKNATIALTIPVMIACSSQYLCRRQRFLGAYLRSRGLPP